MSHDTDGTRDDEGDLPRGVRGSDGKPSAPLADGRDVERTDANEGDGVRAIEAELEEESERAGTLGAISRFSGPLPPAGVLRGYEEIVPGSAANIINAYVSNENARAGALTRLTRAESFGVIAGTIGSQVLTIGGLVAGVTLIVLGYSAESLFGFVPAALGSASLVISAIKGNRAE